MSRTSLCLVPNTRCHFARKKTKKRSYKTSIFENLEDTCGPRIWQALVIVNVYAPAIAKCLQENLSTSDLLPVSNKQVSNAYGGIGFCKEEVKTFPQLLLHGLITGWIMADRYIPFFWCYKFPPGCDNHVSKFPIQSLYYPWYVINSGRISLEKGNF